MEISNIPNNKDPNFHLFIEEESLPIFEKWPMIHMVLMNCTEKRDFKMKEGLHREVIYENSFVYKLYCLESFKQKQEMQIELWNEYNITMIAKEQDCKNLIQLEGVVRGENCVGLKFKKLKYDLHDYFKLYTRPKIMKEILLKIIEGLEELHEMGWVHRDLKPANVVLREDPLEVRIIDFNYSMPVEDLQRRTNRGTPPYYPEDCNLEAGNLKWDSFSVAAMIL